MINVNFFIKKERKYKDGTCPVFFQVSYNGNRIRRPVQGVRVLQNDWDQETGLVKKPKKKDFDNNHREFNTKIAEVKAKIGDINKYILLNKVRITDQFILDRLYQSHKLGLDKKIFTDVFQEYLNVIKATSAKRTIMNKTTVLNFMIEFQTYLKTELYLSSFDKGLFEELRSYAYEEKKIGANYFAKINATIKTFLQWAYEKGLHDSLAFKKFSAPERETEVIYLTSDELRALVNYKFNSKRLEHVRDVYCFCCFTGLRISDAQNLKTTHIQDGQIVKSIMKTQTINSIPLSQSAKAILEKYKGTIREPLPKISIQKFNLYLKECCELAKVDTPTTIVRFSGGERIEDTFPKFKLITSHTARKTFVTNSLILGMTEMVVRNITGHKKEESFRRYVKIADSIKKAELSKAWDNF